jgi:hypothetical protein
MDREWAGTNPFYLLIWPQDSETVSVIDLDEDQWATTYHDLLRLPGRWYLIHKKSMQPALQILVRQGDQPYYTARHFGVVGAPVEVVAYGIGKKRADGFVERLWLLPTGTVCVGDDVDEIGPDLLKRRLVLPPQ